jgi:hypothetical protein
MVHLLEATLWCSLKEEEVDTTSACSVPFAFVGWRCCRVFPVCSLSFFRAFLSCLCGRFLSLLRNLSFENQFKFKCAFLSNSRLPMTKNRSFSLSSFEFLIAPLIFSRKLGALSRRTAVLIVSLSISPNSPYLVSWYDKETLRLVLSMRTPSFLSRSTRKTARSTSKSRTECLVLYQNAARGKLVEGYFTSQSFRG